MGSQRFTLSGTDLWKIIKGGLIAMLGALLTYLAQSVVPALETSGDGVKLMVASILMVLINTAYKFISDNSSTSGP